MPGRIFITGSGVVSAIGTGLTETLASLRESRSGIAPVRFLAMNRSGPAEPQLRELVAMLQRLLLP